MKNHIILYYIHTTLYIQGCIYCIYSCKLSYKIYILNHYRFQSINNFVFDEKKKLSPFPSFERFTSGSRIEASGSEIDPIAGFGSDTDVPSLAVNPRLALCLSNHCTSNLILTGLLQRLLCSSPRMVKIIKNILFISFRMVKIIKNRTKPITSIAVH